MKEDRRNGNNTAAISWRSVFASALIVFILSVLLFDLTNISTVPYLLVIAAGGGLMCIYANSARCSQKAGFLQVSLAFVVNLVSFIGMKHAEGKKFRLISATEQRIIYGIAIVIAVEAVFISVVFLLDKLKAHIFYKPNDRPAGDNNHIANSLYDRIRFDENIIFPSREADYRKLKQLYENNDVIGVEGSWGSGKSFITGKLCDELKNSGKERKSQRSRRGVEKKNEFILLRMFELSGNDVIQVFFWSIDNILRKHGIASRYSRILSGLTNGHRFMEDVKNAVFPDYESIDSVLDEIKSSLINTGCKVTVVIEDIDRLDDPEKVRMIFALSEHLTDERIKFIIEYDPEALEKLDEAFTYDFIEKYIPASIQLSPIHLKEATEFLMDHSNIHQKKEPLFMYEDLRKVISSAEYEAETLLQRLDAGITLDHGKIYVQSIRTVKNFLGELFHELSANEEYYGNATRKRALIAICYIKYFEHELYEQLRINQSPSKTWYILVDDCRLTVGILSQLADEFDQKKKKSKKKSKKEYTEGKSGNEASQYQRIENAEFVRKLKIALDLKVKSESSAFADAVPDETVYQSPAAGIITAYYLLGYEPIPLDYQKKLDERYQLRNKEVPADEMRRIAYWAKVQFKNTEIDKIVWHELVAGSSAYTNEEAFVRRMNEAVLIKKDFSEQKKEFDRLRMEMWNGKFNNGGTVERIGVSLCEDICRAYADVGTGSDNWIRLMGFLANLTRDEKLDVSKLISLVYLASQPSDRVLLAAMKLFLRWDTAYNFIGQPAYRRFIAEYLNQLILLGFLTDGMYFQMFDHMQEASDEGVASSVIETDRYFADQLKDALTELCGNVAECEKKFRMRGITSASESLEVVSAFLKRNLKIISRKNAFTPQNPVKVSVSSGKRNHRDKETFEKISNNPSAEAIDRAYREGRLDFSEIDELLNVEEAKRG